MEFKSVNKIIENSFRENWDRPALSNYQGVTLNYRDVARRIAKLHIAAGRQSRHLLPQPGELGREFPRRPYLRRRGRAHLA